MTKFIISLQREDFLCPILSPYPLNRLNQDDALLSNEDPETAKSPLEETKEYHARYLRAMNNPLRRQILRALKDGDATIETLQSRTGLDAKELEWHLNILENGACVKKETRNGATLYKLTREGEVVDYVDR